MHVDLLIPELFLPSLAGGMFDRYQGLALPTLESLLGRAQLHRGTPLTPEQWLMRRFGIVSDATPAACLAWRVDGGTADDLPRLRADPVHLQAQRDELVLIDGAQLAISSREAIELVDTLNAHCAADGLAFCAPHPTRWYLTSATPWALRTTPLPDVAGRAVNTRLPQGTDALKLQRHLTEIQMLLHQHPVNQAREARGAPTVNSLWIWGEGQLPTPPTLAPVTMWADDAYARGLALALGLPALPLPAGAQACLAHRGDHLIVWDRLRPAAWYGDDVAWRDGLARLEADWAIPLARAWRQGEIDRLRLVATGTTQTLTFTVDKRSRWALWRRPRSLAHYAPMA